MLALQPISGRRSGVAGGAATRTRGPHGTHAVVVPWRNPDHHGLAHTLGTNGVADRRSFRCSTDGRGGSAGDQRRRRRHHLYLWLLVVRRVSTEAVPSRTRATAPAWLRAPAVVSDAGSGTAFGLSWSNPANPAGTPYTVKYATTGGAWIIWLLDTAVGRQRSAPRRSRSRPGPVRPTGSRCCRRTRTATTPGTPSARWSSRTTSCQPASPPLADTRLLAPVGRNGGGHEPSGCDDGDVSRHRLQGQRRLGDTCPLRSHRAPRRRERPAWSPTPVPRPGPYPTSPRGCRIGRSPGRHVVVIKVVGTTGRPALHLGRPRGPELSRRGLPLIRSAPKCEAPRWGVRGRVLVVDDDQARRKRAGLLCAERASSPFSSRTVTKPSLCSGRAVQAILAWLDIMLPGTDGIEVAGHPAGVPIVMLTARADTPSTSWSGSSQVPTTM